MAGQTSVEGKQVLFATEAELFIEQLKTYPLKEIGSAKWMSQHEFIEKLNMQAIISASSQTDEFVKEFLITLEKIPTLIHELLAVELWKQKVFSKILDSGFNPHTTLPVYFVLFHEATVVSLLETILYHKELKVQERTIFFTVCIKCVSVLRYIIDSLTCLPLNVMTRLLNTHNTPVILVQLIENPPWIKRSKGKLMKFIDNKWKVISKNERLQLTKTDGQVWLAVYQLLMNEDCQRKYEFNSYSKEQILKLRGYMNEVLLDQIPSLMDLQRYLEQLAIMEPPAIKKDIILEQVPEIRENLLKCNQGKWEKIAKYQKRAYFSPSAEDVKKQAKTWADTYNLDMLEELASEPPKCATCGQSATKRCSRCQTEWYCSRECQVKHWSKHKPACNLVVETKS
ncbi:Zinc finger MYND domain-containing protein 10 [Acropora cervicornis]|uniref:Zinc finger MYND domain-containing protein 10 n=1 Tax=Acropora cervicornis TaxID=6130 RepID=A0AAD9V739_ACRCE|nr:Zinc finger MYND domain-containing protein 10 [Acropora cervicornis]